MLSALLDHLWQSSLFAVGVGILTFMLRRNSAGVRFGLWFSASVKFLVPFALLSELGSRLPRYAPPLNSVNGAHAFGTVIHGIAVPMAGMSRMIGPEPALSAPGHPVLSILGVLWACGVVALGVYWFIGWRQIRRALAASAPANIDFPIPVRTSAAMQEPAVAGIVRPVLLVPYGIEEWLSATQLRAVLAHERCHVRRRDNLTAGVHMLVEAVFWFHPLVWWLETRLIAERERACDEEVLTGGNKAQDYAQGILRVCQNYLASPLRCAAGVGGGNLTKRIEGILNRHRHVRLNALQIILLGVVATTVVAGPIVSGHLAASPPDGQDASSDIFRNYVAVAPEPSPPSQGKDLVIAAATGNLGRVRSLLRKGVDIEFVDGSYTALTQAAQDGKDPVVQELLATGAQIEHRRKGGETALILAAGMGHLTVAKRLLDAGAQVNSQSDIGVTALMEAAAHGHRDLALLLLSRGADVNLAAKGSGETALLRAARAGHDGVVRLLLDFGADFQHRRSDGQTALDLAAGGRRAAVVETLLQRGAGSKP